MGSVHSIHTRAPLNVQLHVQEVVDPVHYAYSHLLEHSGDLIDIASHTATREQAVEIAVYADYLVTRCELLKHLAARRIERLNEDAHEPQ
jgi:hypothetical protein